MSNDPKFDDDARETHMEKQVMSEPQEEFVADQSVPSRSMQSGKSEETSAQRASDVKLAGHENKEPGHNIEPGVEG